MNERLTRSVKPMPHRACLISRMLGAAALMLAAGVATQAAAVELVPEAAVRKLANERWQLLIEGKYEDAYQYLAPGFRAVQSYKTYTSRLASTAWVGGDAVRVECNDERDKCSTTLRLESKAFLPGLTTGNLTTYVDETWIRQDGKWWLFPQL